MVEEVRRSLLLPATDSEGDFMEKSVSELRDKLDILIYYGISKGTLKPPANLTEGKK